MTALYSHRYVLRATLEFTTPFLIGSGRSGDIADAVFVADANGLPAIPGSSIAGVLRAAFGVHGKDAQDQLFGYQRGRDGEGSRLRISWACIHDSRNVPVEEIVAPDRLSDPVLAKAMSPRIRDHVRINHKGASDAEEHGKFDEQAVCAGHRFTFELELAGTESHRATWQRLLAVLADPALRLGGKTRRGFGAFAIVSCKAREFVLRTDFDAYAEHPVALSEPSASLSECKLSAPRADSNEIEVRLSLSPSGYWMFGGGQDPSGEADMASVRDCRIVWENGRALVEEELLVIPATAVKGAISHRTAFHYNRLCGVFAEDISGSELKVTGENNPAVRELFGLCKGKKNTSDGNAKEEGRRGRVILDDFYVPSDRSPSSQLVHHVGIDRFTGGARDQVLFSERPLWKGSRIEFVLRVTEADRITDGSVRKAFACTLDDLANGRLQLGAGSGRGSGYFEGSVTWPDGKNWKNG